jgi:hypothetical protein
MDYFKISIITLLLIISGITGFLVFNLFSLESNLNIIEKRLDSRIDTVNNDLNIKIDSTNENLFNFMSTYKENILSFCVAQEVYGSEENSIGSCDDICKSTGLRYFNTEHMFCISAQNIIEENGLVKSINSHFCNDKTIMFPKTCTCCVYN